MEGMHRQSPGKRVALPGPLQAQRPASTSVHAHQPGSSPNPLLWALSWV